MSTPLWPPFSDRTKNTPSTINFNDCIMCSFMLNSNSTGYIAIKRDSSRNFYSEFFRSITNYGLSSFENFTYCNTYVNLPDTINRLTWFCYGYTGKAKMKVSIINMSRPDIEFNLRVRRSNKSVYAEKKYSNCGLCNRITLVQQYTLEFDIDLTSGVYYFPEIQIQRDIDIYFVMFIQVYRM